MSEDTSADRFVELGDGVRLCYRSEGPETGTPLLLVAGLGQHLTAWPQPFVEALVARGFRVVRHDNRDAGRSSRAGTPAPSSLRQLAARRRTWPRTPSAFSTTSGSSGRTWSGCRWAA